MQLEIEFSIKMIIAFIAGVLIGYERDINNKPAGIKTIMLITVGAGAILKSEERIVGVTTAATIWISAAIGIAIGTGFYIPAFLGVTFVLLLDPISRLQYRWGIKTKPYQLKLNAADRNRTLDVLRDEGVEYLDEEKEDSEFSVTILSSEQIN